MDLLKLATEAEKRACALAVMKAEEATTLSITRAEKISQEIAETQKMLIVHTQNPGILEQYKEKLATLREQETLAEECVNAAIDRLARLTSALASSAHVPAPPHNSPQSQN